MTKIALVVEFGVKPERRTDFIKLMRHHAALTLEAEPGCEQFDVLTPDEPGNSVFLYELYRDRKALDEHMSSAHLAATRGSYDDMITTKRVVRCELV